MEINGLNIILSELLTLPRLGQKGGAETRCRIRCRTRVQKQGAETSAETGDKHI
jgi:hypothetical protein